MTTFYHTPIATGASANAATFNTPYGQLDENLRNLNGYGGAVDQWLYANYGSVRITGNIVEDETYPGIIEQADIIWPDGSIGLYTSLVVDPIWLESVEWSISHNLSGKTIEGRNLVRDSNGLITIPEAVTIAVY